MNTNQVIRHFKTRANAIKQLGIYRQLLEGWEKKGRIPLWRQQAIELATQGKLKVDR